MRALIVDDESSVRTGLLLNLPWMDLSIDEVLEADDGVSGWEVAQQVHLDLVLSDIRMPRMDGIDLCTRVRSRFPQCVLILMTGYADKDYLKRAIQLQVLGFLEKPIHLPEAEELLREAVKVTQSRIMSHQLIEAQVEQRWTDALDSLLVGASTGHRRSETLQAVLPQQNYTVLLVCFRSLSSGALPRPWLEQSNTAPHSIFRSRVHGKEQLVLVALELSEVSRLWGLRGLDEDCFVAMTSWRPMEWEDSWHQLTAQRTELFYRGFGTFSNRLPVFSNVVDFESELAATLGFLDDRDSQALVRHWNDLEVRLRRRTEDPQRVRDFATKLAAAAAKVALDRGYSEVLRIYSSSFLVSLIESATLDEVVGPVKLFLEAHVIATKRRLQTNRLVEEVQEYVRRHYSEGSLRIADIANTLSVSEVYLSRRYKMETGQTIHDFLVGYRVLQAKKELRNLRLSLAEVAFKTGFSDASYFTKVFKASVGVPPSAFRDLEVPKGKI